MHSANNTTILYTVYNNNHESNSANCTNNSCYPSAGSRDLHQFYFNLNGVTGTIVCIVGLLGNLLNAATLSAMLHRRQTSTTIFLLVMAVADLLVLLIYLIYGLSCIALPSKPILSYEDVQGLEGTFTYFIFYVWYFPANVFMTSSNWCIVSVMFFRFIAVYFPLRATQHCSVSRARLTVTLIIICSSILILPEFLTVRIERNDESGFTFRDTKLFSDNNFNTIYYPLVEVCNSFAPFIICSLLSIMLVRTLRRAHNSRASLSSNNQERSSMSSHVRLPKRRNEQRRISIMLLGITIWFILCTCPSFVCRILKLSTKNTRLEQSWIKTRAVADLFLLLNHATNFALYAATSHSYRKHLVDLVLCRDRKSIDRERTIAQSISMRSVKRYLVPDES